MRRPPKDAGAWSCVVDETRVMKSKPTLLLPLLVATSLASAAQFESIIDAMAIKSAEGHTNNSWEDTAKIKGVKWRWRG